MSAEGVDPPRGLRVVPYRKEKRENEDTQADTTAERKSRNAMHEN